MPELAIPARLVVPAVEPYPERERPRSSQLEQAAASVQSAWMARTTARRARSLTPVIEAVAAHGPGLAALDDDGLRRAAKATGAALRRRPDWPLPDVARAFAVVREASVRVLGQRHHDVQLAGGLAILRGMVAEMATGEGKTLAATLAAATAALAGVPVHVVTVNGYLAERDARATGPLYRMLGLSVGVATGERTPAERRAAYRCNVAYCTSKDLAFDYMRDRMAAGRRLGNLTRKAASLTPSPAEAGPLFLRGLHFAMVDEVDSVLIDEARTPLILSGTAPAERAVSVFDAALDIARGLVPGAGFVPVPSERRVELTAAGRTALALEAGRGPPWDEVAERERLVGTALTALHLLHEGEHYLVRGGKAEIVDEYTGRTMPDRSWSDELQEMVERKEGLALSERRITQSRMTYQRFFRRYCRLGGMSGTVREIAGELWRTYRLPVATIPLNRPDAKVVEAWRAFATDGAKWRAITQAVAEAQRKGTPVLIGTRTVAASARAGAALEAAGLRHVVLSASQDGAEAEIVARAGEAGTITVATNMAGRGTDIRLSDAARAFGGLHVVISEPHEAGRIDRQLAGRCGRQGDPGRVTPYVSLEDALLARHASGWSRGLAGWGGHLGIVALAMLSQRRAESLHARMRRELQRSDEWVGDAVGFAGAPE